jgi:hypothetical protein
VTKQAQADRRKAIGRVLVELGLPAVASVLGVGFATPNWPLAFATGLAISSAVLALYWLDQRFVHPLCWLLNSSTRVSCTEISEIGYHSVQSTTHLESITA